MNNWTLLQYKRSAIKQDGDVIKIKFSTFTIGTSIGQPSGYTFTFVVRRNPCLLILTNLYVFHLPWENAGNMRSTKEIFLLRMKKIFGNNVLDRKSHLEKTIHKVDLSIWQLRELCALCKQKPWRLCCIISLSHIFGE